MWSAVVSNRILPKKRVAWANKGKVDDLPHSWTFTGHVGIAKAPRNPEIKKSKLDMVAHLIFLLLLSS